MAEINISRPDDEVSDAIFEDLRVEATSGSLDGVNFRDVSGRNFGPEMMEGFVIGVVSGLTANKITALVNFTVSRFKERRYHGVPLGLVYKSKLYRLPVDMQDLKDAIQDDPER